ncbi:MAG TPA: hypothetical protein VLT32_07650 [Candidatus Sulfomarinibacteraceae bacterium]|nr:hypothetical protein [Candidatus Sulfomarinibacteraceae bacterium]
MKTRNFIVIFVVAACALLFLADSPGWADRPVKVPKPKPTQPPDEDPPPMDYPFYFWRLGHMDGPHDSAKALGISRDGKVAVGSTVVVEFVKAWRMDIDWAIATDDGVPPLYNELQVQESIGGEAAYAASDMTVDTCPYDKVAENLDWCGSLPVGTLTTGTVSYAAEWLWAYDAEAVEPNYVAIPDFGGGISDMTVNDVSVDGFVLVGTGNTKTGMQAFRADTTVVDENGVPVPAQLTITDTFYTEQTLQTSSAQAVSADGTIIAGYGGTKTGNKAFVTTFLGIDGTTGEAILESYVLPAIDGGQWSEAYAMTPDGLYIAGRSDSPKGPQACIWFQGDDPATPDVETWVVKGLGGLSTKKYDSVATGIVQRPGAPDGELMVVGSSKSILYPSEAFVWAGNPVLEDDEIGYMYDLEYILIKTGAGEASGMGSSWILNEATGVALNDDLTARIVGWGINPEGGVEAWLAGEFPYGELEPLFVKE